jgi:hypothetical protein
MDSIMVEKESGGESSPVQPQGGAPSPAAQNGGGFDIPSINLPKGGGAIRVIGEKFAANPVTGTGSMSVPIATSPGRPRVTQEITNLVVRMARENDAWGYDRVQGALANLGHIIAPNTVKNILKRRGIEPAPEREKRTSWKTFLKAHWDVMAAKDFFTVEVWTPRGLMTYYVLFIMRLSTRSVHIAGVTTAPDFF